MNAPALARPATSGIAVQRRLVELGRIRLGEKGTKGEPKKLTKFRLTSASRPLLETAARLYGGTVRSWKGAPDEGMWELYTETDALDVMVPPILSAYSQFYEVWDAGGCTLRCDGHWESVAGAPCDHGEHEGMKVTTRVSVILPKLPGLGVWRLETHGWNAAATLPSSLELIGVVGRWIPAVIRLEQRSSRTRDDASIDPRTQKPRVLVRRFVVPVIDLVGVSFAEMLAMGRGDDEFGGPALAPVAAPASGALPAQAGPSRPPRSTRVARPELPAPPELPKEAAAFSAPVAKPFPDEQPAVEEPQVGSPAEAQAVIDEGSFQEPGAEPTLADAIRAAAIVDGRTELAGAATAAVIESTFAGWDRSLILDGLAVIWPELDECGKHPGRARVVNHPTAAQVAALKAVGDGMAQPALVAAWRSLVDGAAA